MARTRQSSDITLRMKSTFQMKSIYEFKNTSQTLLSALLQLRVTTDEWLKRGMMIQKAKKQFQNTKRSTKLLQVPLDLLLITK